MFIALELNIITLICVSEDLDLFKKFLMIHHWESIHHAECRLGWSKKMRFQHAH